MPLSDQSSDDEEADYDSGSCPVHFATGPADRQAIPEAFGRSIWSAVKVPLNIALDSTKRITQRVTQRITEANPTGPHGCSEWEPICIVNALQRTKSQSLRIS